MGIKDLWTILTPYCERKPLSELQGKCVAIDLSGWVCQAQCIIDYQVQPRMYLRNLFFRTCFLLLQDVRPVFVLEGEAPTLKHRTIADRNAVQFKGAKPRKNGERKAATEKGRTRFGHTLRKCEEMLRLMGLECLTGKGEAEAMCAHLNAKQIVYGCISQDSDCFAYGATRVFRNFSISQHGSSGFVDIYNLERATESMDFGRNKVVVLALLCGSDYNKGVHGVGKEAALRLFGTIPDRHVLERVRSWTNEDFKVELCSNCRHYGERTGHEVSGCVLCKTGRSCNYSEDKKGCKNEASIRSKALSDPNFPNEELVREFLVDKDAVAKVDVSWRMPDLRKFLDFADANLEWEPIYSFEKFFPLLTRWLVTHNKDDKSGLPRPKEIVKRRNPKGVRSYEILWNCESYEDVFASASDDVDVRRLSSTIEPEHLVEQKYEHLIADFEAGRKKKPASKRRRAAPTIDQYLAKKPSLDTSRFSDEEDEFDASLIVSDIIAQGLPDVVREKLSSFFTFAAADEPDDFELSLRRNDADDGSEDSFDEEYVPLHERLRLRNEKCILGGNK